MLAPLKKYRPVKFTVAGAWISALWRPAVFLFALGGIGLLKSATGTAAEVRVRLDPSKTYQTISGWEATIDLVTPGDPPPEAAYPDELLDRVVTDVGIDRVRLEIRSGAETPGDAPTRFLSGELDSESWKRERYNAVNDNDDPFVINPDGFNFDELDHHVRTVLLPMRERLARRGETLYVNLCYVSFRDGRFFQMQPEEYAEFVLATYRHLDETFGFVPDQWELVLEPDQPKSHLSGRVLGEAMVAAGRRLEQAGYTPSFAAPSVVDMSNAVPWTREILGVPGAADYLDELSYHRYRGIDRRELDRIARLAEERGLRTAMLELWFGRATAEVLYEDLTAGRNAAWQGRVVRGLMEVAADGPDDQGRYLTYRAPEVRYTRLYFTAIDRGAVRIGARSSDETAFAPVAFRNPDGTTAVVVLGRKPGTVTVGDLPPGEYEVHLVAGGRDEITRQTVGADGTATVTLRAKGVVSFRG